MFSKAALLSVVLPLVAGLTLQAPSNPTSGGSITVNWDFQPSDPVFSLFLVNEDFHDTFGIANNVQPTQGSLTLTLPSVPVRDGYTLRAVNIGNINQVYSETGSFSVGGTASTTGSSSSTGSSSVSSSTSRSGSSTTVVTSSTTRVSSSTTTSAFGSTVTNPSASNTVSGSSTISGSGAPAATSNAAAAALKINRNFGAAAAVVLSVIAGAAVFAL